MAGAILSDAKRGRTQSIAADSSSQVFPYGCRSGSGQLIARCVIVGLALDVLDGTVWREGYEYMPSCCE